MGNFHFSMKSLFAFFGFCILFSVMVALNQAGGHFDSFVPDAVLGFFLFGSFIIVVRMWRSRGDRKEFWRTAHWGQLSVLPPKWRRWVLGEDDPR